MWRGEMGVSVCLEVAYQASSFLPGLTFCRTRHLNGARDAHGLLSMCMLVYIYQNTVTQTHNSQPQHIQCHIQTNTKYPLYSYYNFIHL